MAIKKIFSRQLQKLINMGIYYTIKSYFKAAIGIRNYSSKISTKNTYYIYIIKFYSHKYYKNVVQLFKYYYGLIKTYQ